MIQRAVWILSCLLAGAAFCQEPDPLLLPSLEGLFIIGSGSDCTIHESCGISFQQFDLPGLEECLAEELLPYLHSPLTEQGLCSLKETIARFFETQHRPLVFVFVPEQEIKENRLHIQVIESRLGEIKTCHQKWFDGCTLAKQIRLCKGEPINSHLLSRDLLWLNRNPFREIDAIFTPGKEPYTTDIELIVRDRCPVRFFSGVDNVGIPETGRTRYVAGLQASNFFAPDHIGTYQFSSGNHYEEFHSHFLQYHWPLPWRNLLDLYGAYAHTEADHCPFFIRGRSSLGSFRYTIPLYLEEPWRVLEWGFGFDFKRTNNNLLFSDEPLFAKAVNLTQFIGFLHVGYCKNAHQLLWNTYFYGSPGNFMGEDGKRSHFQLLRAGSTNHYLYVNSGLYYQYCLPCRGSLILELRGQGATANLLQSEQFGLGGYDTVRGYDEHQVNKDNALLFNMELRTPRIALIDRWHLRDYEEGLQLLAFFDYGFGKNHKGEGSKHLQTLLAVGPGLRYAIDPYLSFRLDFGMQIKKLFEEHKLRSRLHFALFLNIW